MQVGHANRLSILIITSENLPASTKWLMSINFFNFFKFAVNSLLSIQGITVEVFPVDRLPD
jgi:hypothetical protein